MCAQFGVLSSSLTVMCRCKRFALLFSCLMVLKLRRRFQLLDFSFSTEGDTNNWKIWIMAQQYAVYVGAHFTHDEGAGAEVGVSRETSAVAKKSQCRFVSRKRTLEQFIVKCMFVFSTKKQCWYYKYWIFRSSGRLWASVCIKSMLIAQFWNFLLQFRFQFWIPEINIQPTSYMRSHDLKHLS